MAPSHEEMAGRSQGGEPGLLSRFESLAFEEGNDGAARAFTGVSAAAAASAATATAAAAEADARTRQDEEAAASKAEVAQATEIRRDRFKADRAAAAAVDEERRRKEAAAAAEITRALQSRRARTAASRAAEAERIAAEGAAAAENRRLRRQEMERVRRANAATTDARIDAQLAFEGRRRGEGRSAGPQTAAEIRQARLDAARAENEVTSWGRANEIMTLSFPDVARQSHGQWGVADPNGEDTPTARPVGDTTPASKERECMICLSPSKPMEAGGPLIRFCDAGPGHWYHAPCLFRWLLKDPARICPLRCQRPTSRSFIARMRQGLLDVAPVRGALAL